MTSILCRSSFVLGLVWLFTAAPLRAADEGRPAPDVGVVHAAGDEAWVDVPASLGDTWKATLAELKLRGKLADADLSYVESNGQIALDALWIAVLPGASLDTPITRVRMVVLVSADDHEQHTAALVGAGALLGAIAQRLPAASATPAPFGALPAPAAYADEVLVEPGATTDGLVATYNTYNTYNTYDNYPGYDTVAPVYVGYAPSVVYVWKPWWWLGWCNNDWYFGWNTWGWWGSSCWNGGWGWGWNSCPPVSNCNPWWWDCNNNFTNVPTNPGASQRARFNYNHAPSLSFAGRTNLAGGLSGSGAGSSLDAGRSRPGPVAHEQPRLTPRSSVGLTSVEAFPRQHVPSVDHGRSGRTFTIAPSSGSQSSRSIVVSGRSSSSSRAKPGSVTKLKGLTLTTKLGAIHDAGSLARASASVASPSSSPSFSSSSGSRPASPFTIGDSNGSRSSSSSHGSSSSGHSYPGLSSGPSSSSHGSSSSSNRPSGSHASPAPASVPSHMSKPSAPAPRSSPAPHAPAPRASGGSLGSSGGHVSGGSSGSIGGGGSASKGSSGGGSSHGSGGRSSGGRGPR